MKKLSFKDLCKHFWDSIVIAYSGKKFFPSLITGLVTALISTIISVFVIKDGFSKNNLVNQILNAIFMYLVITTIFHWFGDLKQGEFLKRFGNTVKNLFSGYRKEKSGIRKLILTILCILVGIGIAQFIPMLFSMILGISLFLSAVAGANSYLGMIGTLILRKCKVVLNQTTVRGRYISGLALGLLIGCLVAFLLTIFGVYGKNEKSNLERPQPQQTTQPTLTTPDEGVGDELSFSEEDIPTLSAPYHQQYSLSDMPMDLFYPGYFEIAEDNEDYMITCFDGGISYTLWNFNTEGEVIAVYGKRVYESKEALVDENPGLTEYSYSEDGNLYIDNILFYCMPEETLEQVGLADKAAYLMSAVMGEWDGYFYYFSKPYLSSDGEFSSESEDPYNADSSDWNDMTDDVQTSNGASVEDSAIFLFEQLTELAGQDYTAFSALFRNTDDSIIQQYYNIDYSDMKQYRKVFFQEITSNQEYSYVTVVFYNEPLDEPYSKMENFMFNSILSCDENGEWKIDYNSESQNSLQEQYYAAIATQGGYQALQTGLPWARPWLPFNTDYAVYFDGAFVIKPIEYYMNDDCSITMTLYISNATGHDVYVGNITSLVITEGDTVITDVSTNLDYSSPDGDATLYTLDIPAQYVLTNGWSSSQITTFEVEITY